MANARPGPPDTHSCSAEQGNRVKIPDTDQARRLLCAVRTKCRLCALSDQSAYRESGSLTPLVRGGEKAGPARRCFTCKHPNVPVRRPTNAVSRPRAPAPRRVTCLFKSSGVYRRCFLIALFSPFRLFPPFFLPYLRQLRQVPVMPGGAAETLCAAVSPHKEFFCACVIARQ